MRWNKILGIVSETLNTRERKPRQDLSINRNPMPAIITITLDKELTEALATYSKASTGKALARESDRLDTAARRRNVAAITSLLSESHANLFAQLQAEGFDPSKMRLPAEQWFPAVDGLKTVRALIEHVTANLNDFKQPNPILRELKAAEVLLAAAEAAGVKFHFTKAAV